jgi:hypothetical protein
MSNKQNSRNEWTEVVSKQHKSTKSPPRTPKPTAENNPYSVLQDEDEPPQDPIPLQLNTPTTRVEQQQHQRLSPGRKQPGRGPA